MSFIVNKKTRKISAKKEKKVKNVKKVKTVKKEKKAKANGVIISKRLEDRLKKMTLENQERFFVLKNGRIIKSMHDLVKSIERMSDDLFSYHVTPYKNDFCSWIYHAFGEVELARLLANEKNKKNTILIIKEFYNKQV